ncbi:hypothetical protein H4R33_000012 [Dimargaris cristalligena]|nr:hypothetical protein H4R33_000012 [Dimargaris cristalligena]
MSSILATLNPTVQEIQEFTVSHLQTRELLSGSLARITSPLPLESTPGFCSLLATSSAYGCLIAATVDGIIVIDVQDLSERWRKVSRGSTPPLADLGRHQAIPIPQGRVHHVALSLDESTLLLGLASGEILVFDLRTLTASSLPLRTLPVPTAIGDRSCAIRDLQPNPKALPNTVAVLYTNGNYSLIDFATENVAYTSGFGGQDRVTALAWSRLGKQLMIGTYHGELRRCSLDGSVTKRVPPPSDLEDTVHQVAHIQLLDNNGNTVVYGEQEPSSAFFDPAGKLDREPPHDNKVYVLSWDKGVENVTFRRCGYICGPTGIQEREDKYFNITLNHWGALTPRIVILAATPSPYFGFLAERTDIEVEGVNGVFRGWEVWDLEEGLGPALPLTRPGDEETSPIGLALYLASTTPLPPLDPDADDPNCPAARPAAPVPIMFVYTTDGTLNAYEVIFKTPITAGISYPDMKSQPTRLRLFRNAAPVAQPAPPLSVPTPAPASTSASTSNSARAEVPRATPPAPPPTTTPAAAAAAPQIEVSSSNVNLVQPTLNQYAARTSTDREDTPTAPVSSAVTPSPPTPLTVEEQEKADTEQLLLQVLVKVYAKYQSEFDHLAEHVRDAGQHADRVKRLAAKQRAVCQKREPDPNYPQLPAHPDLYSPKQVLRIEFTDIDSVREAIQALARATIDVRRNTQASRQALLDLQSETLRLESKRVNCTREVRSFTTRVPGHAGADLNLPPEAGDTPVVDYYAEARQALRVRYSKAVSRLDTAEANIDFLIKMQGQHPPTDDRPGALSSTLDRVLGNLTVAVRDKYETLHRLEAQLVRLELEGGSLENQPNPATSAVLARGYGLGVATPTKPTLAIQSESFDQASPARPLTSRPWRKRKTPAKDSTASNEKSDKDGKDDETTPQCTPSGQRVRLSEPQLSHQPRDHSTYESTDTPPTVAIADHAKLQVARSPGDNSPPVLGTVAELPVFSALTELHQRAHRLQHALTQSVSGSPPQVRVNKCTKPGILPGMPIQKQPSFNLQDKLDDVRQTPVRLPRPPPCPQVALSPGFVNRFASPVHRPPVDLQPTVRILPSPKISPPATPPSQPPQDQGVTAGVRSATPTTPTPSRAISVDRGVSPGLPPKHSGEAAAPPPFSPPAKLVLPPAQSTPASPCQTSSSESDSSPEPSPTRSTSKPTVPPPPFAEPEPGPEPELSSPILEKAANVPLPSSPLMSATQVTPEAEEETAQPEAAVTPSVDEDANSSFELVEQEVEASTESATPKQEAAPVEPKPESNYAVTDSAPSTSIGAEAGAKASLERSADFGVGISEALGSSILAPDMHNCPPTPEFPPQKEPEESEPTPGIDDLNDVEDFINESSPEPESMGNDTDSMRSDDTEPAGPALEPTTEQMPQGITAEQGPSSPDRMSSDVDTPTPPGPSFAELMANPYAGYRLPEALIGATRAEIEAYINSQLPMSSDEDGEFVDEVSPPVPDPTPSTSGFMNTGNQPSTSGFMNTGSQPSPFGLPASFGGNQTIPFGSGFGSGVPTHAPTTISMERPRVVPGLEDDDDDNTTGYGGNMMGMDDDDDLGLAGGLSFNRDTNNPNAQSGPSFGGGPFGPAGGSGFTSGTGFGTSTSSGPTDGSKFFQQSGSTWGSFPSAQSTSTSSAWGGGANTGTVNAFGALSNSSSSGPVPAFAAPPANAFPSANPMASVNHAQPVFGQSGFGQPVFGQSAFGAVANNNSNNSTQSPTNPTAPRTGGFGSYASGSASFASFSQSNNNNQ